MTNSTKVTKYSTIFLAVILVAGTITALFPSFVVGAQADPYYNDMNKEKNVDKKSVSVSSLKCNNINVNVNGLELSVLPSFLGGSELVAEAAEPNTDVNSFANNGGNDGSLINDFRFICINNNNNTVIEAGNETVSTPPVVDPCEECFTEFLTEGQIASFEEFADTSIADLCEFATTPGNALGVGLFIVGLGEAGVNSEVIDALIECLRDAGFNFTS